MLIVYVPVASSHSSEWVSVAFTRFEAVKEVVGRNGTLKASFFLDVRRVDRIRRVNKHKEIVLLKEILNEGVQQGAFRIKHVDKTAEILLMAMQGLDLHYIRDSFADLGINQLKLRFYLKDFLLNGIQNHGNEAIEPIP